MAADPSYGCWRQGARAGWVTALLPLVFGAAHLHHLFELMYFQGWPARQALLQVIVGVKIRGHLGPRKFFC